MTDLDFDTQNLINQYRNRLTDIMEWREQLTDTITTITGYSMDLSGVTTNHGPRLPGGDALTMLCGYSDGNLEPDDTPHPAQIIIEGARLIDKWQGRAERQYTLAEAFHRNSQALPWLHQHGHLTAWAQDINALWWRLGTLTGHIKPDPPQPPTREQLWQALHDHPETHIPRAALPSLGYNPSTLTTWKARRKLTPQPDGTYLAAHLLENPPPM